MPGETDRSDEWKDGARKTKDHNPCYCLGIQCEKVSRKATSEQQQERKTDKSREHFVKADHGGTNGTRVNSIEHTKKRTCKCCPNPQSDAKPVFEMNGKDKCNSSNNDKANDHLIDT